MSHVNGGYRLPLDWGVKGSNLCDPIVYRGRTRCARFGFQSSNLMVRNACRFAESPGLGASFLDTDLYGKFALNNPQLPCNEPLLQLHGIVDGLR